MRPIFLSAILLLAAVPTARAQEEDYSYIIPGRCFEHDIQFMDLHMVRSVGDGVVRIVAPGTDEVLAETPVHAGANHEVRMQFRTPLRNDVHAMLYVGDEPMANVHITLGGEGQACD